MAALYGSSVVLSLISILFGRNSTRRGFLGWKLVATSLMRFLCVQVVLLASGTYSLSATFLETPPRTFWPASAGNLMLLPTTRLRINDAYLPREIGGRRSCRHPRRPGPPCSQLISRAIRL
jgi:hypothetical protein